MPMRLQELHPALVHMPIALLPVTLVTDAVGRGTRNRALLDVARVGIGVTAASAAVAGLAGLLAQESARFDAETREMLVTHRTLNLGLIGLTTWMAARRSRDDIPSNGYLGAGIAGVAVMAYSAYLGGRMVYGHGVGVEAADGIVADEAPELEPANVGEVVRVAGQHVTHGLRDVLGTAARGELVPSLRHGHDGRRPAVQAEREPAERASATHRS